MDGIIRYYSHTHAVSCARGRNFSQAHACNFFTHAVFMRTPRTPAVRKRLYTLIIRVLHKLAVAAKNNSTRASCLSRQNLREQKLPRLFCTSFRKCAHRRTRMQTHANARTRTQHVHARKRFGCLCTHENSRKC